MTKNEKEKDVEANEEKDDEKDDPQDEKPASVLTKALIPLSEMHGIWNTFNLEPRTKLDDELYVSTAWVKSVEKGLESLLWQRYFRESTVVDKYLLYVADAAEAGLKTEKVVLFDSPQGIPLLFCGPVSSEPSLNSKKIAELPNGVCFYVHPPPQPPNGDIVVPAWLAKPSAKNALVTLDSDTREVEVYVDEFGDVFDYDPGIFEEVVDELKHQADKYISVCESSEFSNRKAKSYRAKKNIAESRFLSASLEVEELRAKVQLLEGKGKAHEGEPAATQQENTSAADTVVTATADSAVDLVDSEQKHDKPQDIQDDTGGTPTTPPTAQKEEGEAAATGEEVTKAKKSPELPEQALPGPGSGSTTDSTEQHLEKKESSTSESTKAAAAAVAIERNQSNLEPPAAEADAAKAPDKDGDAPAPTLAAPSDDEDVAVKAAAAKAKEAKDDAESARVKVELARSSNLHAKAINFMRLKMTLHLPLGHMAGSMMIDDEEE